MITGGITGEKNNIHKHLRQSAESYHHQQHCYHHHLNCKLIRSID